MSTRSMLVLGLCLIVCCFILGKSFGETPAQAQAAQPGVGRYQVISAVNSSGHQVVILDSITGHCWITDSGRTWSDLGSPSEKRGKAR